MQDSSKFSSSRRQFLAGVAGVAASVLLPCKQLFGQESSKPPESRGWIDVHRHFSPPAYTQTLIDKNILPGPMRGWSVQKTLEDMDQGGVATAMNSIVVPGVWFGDADQARRLARDSNEYAAKLVFDYPGRFGNFASVTLPDIDGSLKEIEYSFDTLKADGIQLLSSYDNKWLGDRFFAPVFEELNRRTAIVFVHPTDNECCRNLLPGVSNATIEYGTDTTRAIVRMIYSGASKQYPDMRMIFSHAGGTMPFLIGRFVHRVTRTGEKNKRPDDFQAEAGRFYYDTAQSFNRVPMTALRQVVPMSQIVFGTDYPYRSSLESTEGLIESKVFSASELQAIKRENTLKLLPRFNRN